MYILGLLLLVPVYKHCGDRFPKERMTILLIRWGGDISIYFKKVLLGVRENENTNFWSCHSEILLHISFAIFSELLLGIAVGLNARHICISK